MYNKKKRLILLTIFEGGGIGHVVNRPGHHVHKSRHDYLKTQPNMMLWTDLDIML